MSDDDKKRLRVFLFYVYGYLIDNDGERYLHQYLSGSYENLYAVAYNLEDAKMIFLARMKKAYGDKLTEDMIAKLRWHYTELKDCTPGSRGDDDERDDD